jgi:hypothetical protein
MICRLKILGSGSLTCRAVKVSAMTFLLGRAGPADLLYCFGRPLAGSAGGWPAARCGEAEMPPSWLLDAKTTA